MNVIFEDGTALEYSGHIIAAKRNIRGEFRESLELTIPSSTYDELSALFADGVKFSIEGQVRIPIENPEEGQPDFRTETQVFDKSKYTVAGPITDLRNGLFSVQVGVKTDYELLEEEYSRVVSTTMNLTRVMSESDLNSLIEEGNLTREDIDNIIELRSK